MRPMIVLLLAMVCSPAAAQQTHDREPSIQVSGTATVSTKPDIATLVYWVTGEGKTPDAASTDLATKQKAIVAGLTGLLGQETRLSSGEVSVIETRSAECDGPGNYNNRPRLSEGACTVTGYIASLRGDGRTTAVTKAGTAAGLAARLGARDARVQSFELASPADAQRRATTAAIADARARAEGLASGAGVKLGSLLSLNDQNAMNDITLTGASQRAEFAPPPPPPPAAPVEIAVSPRPIETTARVFAQFAIAR